MGRNRDIYFAKYCQNAPTVEKYMEGLMKSPFRTHQRMAQALLPELKKLIEDQQKIIDEVKEVTNET